MAYFGHEVLAVLKDAKLTVLAIVGIGIAIFAIKKIANKKKSILIAIDSRPNSPTTSDHKNAA
jgi:hypothetical protein